MNNLITKTVLMVLLLGGTFVSLQGQAQSKLDAALRYVEQNHDQWKLDSKDVTDMMVSNQYQTKQNKVTHFYFMQRYAGIPVHNAIIGVHVTAEGKVGYATSRFIPNVASKVNAITPLLSAQQAIIKAALALQLPGKAAPVYISKTDQGELIFNDENISRSPIKVRLMYQSMRDGSLHLAWDMAIQQVNTADYWSVRIDALAGDLLDKNNWTLYCNFPKAYLNERGENCMSNSEVTNAYTSVKNAVKQQHLFLLDGAKYDVLPLPLEDPLHGNRQLIVNPADPLASPFGWHDTDGFDGPEYTITQGNNVHAFADTQGNNVSNNDEPNGGANLIFDFPFDQNAEPAAYKDASTTQLFYLNNFMHDFSYHYGFDEQAGNFQQNNYGNGGKENDYVVAQSQDASGDDNANFSTPPDGSKGSMQMYLWTRNDANLLTVNTPEVIAGSYETGAASFGPQITNTPITGQVVEAYDSSSDPKKACGTIVNAAQVAGKIAMIDRGACYFQDKVNNAQQAGAIAVIICNFEDNTIPMGKVNGVQNPGIPSVMLSSSNCQLLRVYLNEGLTVTLKAPNATGPTQLDGSFDNVIVTHEYTHGISTRLTGGPATADCLNNEENMGEGWSDFFALAVTTEPGSVGETARGIGSYVWNRELNGKGFRRLPYSTDMNVNGQTYDDIIGVDGETHNIGEVWTDVLWDLYWKFSEVYGWDADIYNGNGGNNMALRLVIDGLKLQSCSPGFLDGRDAILAADLLDYDGANQCLIWEVFARRGLGYDAEEGSTDNANDGRSGFQTLPECVKQLKIAKTATPLINPGDNITYTITVTNHKDEAVSGVVVTDQLPTGTTYIAGSASGNAQSSVENGVIRFEIGTMQSGNSLTLTYKVQTSAANRSIRQFYDDMENGFDNWGNDVLKGADVWDISDQIAHSGTHSLFVPNTEREDDQIAYLVSPYLVSGNHPVLHFYNDYDTDPGLDGGIVQVSADNGATWQTLDSQFIRNGYYGRISYNTFATPGLRAYTGKSNGFLDSYIDLSAYTGQEILLRFRFASDAESLLRQNIGTGWAVDDVEFMDMYSYQSEACVTSEQGDHACATAPDGGTIVKSDAVMTGANDVTEAPVAMQLYPNPANDVVNLSISTQDASAGTLSIFSADGQLMQRRQLSLYGKNQTIPVNVSDLASGFYFVELKTGDSVITKKMIVN